jgi:hypothetical protein
MVVAVLLLTGCGAEREPYYPEKVANLVATGIFDGDPPAGADLSASCESTGPGPVDTDGYRCRVRYNDAIYVLALRWDRRRHVWPWEVLRSNGPTLHAGQRGVAEPGPFDPDPDADAVHAICARRQGRTMIENRRVRVLRLDRNVGPNYRRGSVMSCRPGDKQPFTINTPPQGAIGKLTLRGLYLAYVSEDFDTVTVVDLRPGGTTGRGCPEALKPGATLTIDAHGNPGWRNGSRHGRC